MGGRWRALGTGSQPAERPCSLAARDACDCAAEAAETAGEACSPEQQCQQLVISQPLRVPAVGDPGVSAEAAFRSFAAGTQKNPGPPPPASRHQPPSCWEPAPCSSPGCSASGACRPHPALSAALPASAKAPTSAPTSPQGGRGRGTPGRRGGSPCLPAPPGPARPGAPLPPPAPAPPRRSGAPSARQPSRDTAGPASARARARGVTVM